MNEIPISEVAHKFKLNPTTVRGWIRTGQLQSNKQNGVHLVDINVLNKFLAERSSSTKRAGAIGSAHNRTQAVEPMLSDSQSLIDNLRDERDYLRAQLTAQRTEHVELLKSYNQLAAELRAFLQGKTAGGIFDFGKLFKR